MKPTKTIDVKLNGLYDATFTLEFKQDKDGNEIGFLTAPFVKWFSFDLSTGDYENAIWERNYELSGKLLECVEKQYFDNNVVSISVKGYPYPVEMEDVIHKVITQEIYDQMINGTYEIADDEQSLLG